MATGADRRRALRMLRVPRSQADPPSSLARVVAAGCAPATPDELPFVFAAIVVVSSAPPLLDGDVDVPRCPLPSDRSRRSPLSPL